MPKHIHFSRCRILNSVKFANIIQPIDSFKLFYTRRITKRKLLENPFTRRKGVGRKKEKREKKGPPPCAVRFSRNIVTRINPDTDCARVPGPTTCRIIPDPSLSPSSSRADPRSWWKFAESRFDLEAGREVAPRRGCVASRSRRLGSKHS